MKKIILAFVLVCSSFICFGDEPSVNEKVLAAFNNTFPDVKNVSWTSSGLSYQVNFKYKEVVTRITYDKNGTCLQTIRYYKGDQLPMLILTKVKSKFSKKQIFGVTELTTEDETSYYIILEDDKTWMNVKADANGSLSIESKYKKA
jgi:hypothetical protein